MAFCAKVKWVTKGLQAVTPGGRSPIPEWLSADVFGKGAAPAPPPSVVRDP